MKKLVVALLISLLAISMTACNRQGATPPNPPAGEALSEPQLEQLANDYVRAFIAKDFDAMLQFAMEEKYKDAMTKDTLLQVNDQISALAGTSPQLASTSHQQKNGYHIYTIIVEYELANMEYLVTLNDRGALAGFFVKPFNGAIERDNRTSDRQSAHITKQVTFGQAPYLISGTLTLPSERGNFAVAVMVHGSGPNDRDETIYQNRPFYDLAEGLAAAGIASLRYDKRSLTYGQEMRELQASDHLTIFDETVDDAVFAIELLKSEAQIDASKIFVIGHSLGANQAPRIAEKSKDVAGLIMMAGNVSYIQDVFAEQIPYLSQLDGTISPDEQQSIDRAKDFQDALNSNYSPATPVEKTLGLGYNYWKDLYRYNPATVAATLTVPMLILQGDQNQ